MGRSVLQQARGGSAAAFRELVEPHRGELHLHCYRMLGSLADAEDLVQETLLAAWRGLDGFAGRSSIRTWLYRIATNRCRNALRDASRRIPAEPVPPFAPPAPSRRAAVTWLQPYPDAALDRIVERAPDPAARYLSRETVELAFVTAVQQLPPRQAAVLLLCDVLDFGRTEVATMLDTTPNGVKGTLQRARASLAEHRETDVRDAVQGRVRPPAGGGDDAGAGDEWELARRFAVAFTADDIDGVLALLTDQAWLAMPPAPHEYHRATAIRAFLAASTRGRGGRRLRLVPTGANRQPAFGCYLDDRPGADDVPATFDGVLVLTPAAGRIGRITRFLDPSLAEPFELPVHR
ncbi:RNA polymerase sigma factor [Actinocatenispora thailandica]|uniref:RNA polymerase sigma factor n=1 Tax=Actinocatenispora thailandica TaxID=227318 RepID=A0A7R7DWK2_9ACTN|nr:RNA polymerase subunit sigma-70 [Actinocatenispora thailandica]BCJ39195.1 RNA polymerase sigma factor [Actinocatenispora thailandica]